VNPEPHFENGRELICFEADIHGHPVRIEIGRETIEDRTRVDSMAPEELLEFVKRNRVQIVENVRGYTRTAQDVTGIRVNVDLLAHCD
jgi:Protein of unknown function (DUF1488)